jgi:hypothetical protein
MSKRRVSSLVRKLHDAVTFVLDLDLADLTAHADESGRPTSCTVTRAPRTASFSSFLDALIAWPGAAQASLRALRDALVNNDPILALVK